MIIIWLIRCVLLFYSIMGISFIVDLSKRRWRWLEYLFTMWLHFSQWRENLWDDFFLRNHQACTSEPRISPRDSYLSLILEICWSLAQLLLFVSLHTHPKRDSDVCTYNQSPLCLSVVIATNIFPFKDMCVVFSSVNGLQLWRHENYQMSSPTRFKKVSPVSQFAKASYNLSPGGQSQPTPTHSSSCTITWMNRWLI